MGITHVAANQTAPPEVRQYRLARQAVIDSADNWRSSLEQRPRIHEDDKATGNDAACRSKRRRWGSFTQQHDAARHDQTASICCLFGPGWDRSRRLRVLDLFTGPQGK